MRQTNETPRGPTRLATFATAALLLAACGSDDEPAEVGSGPDVDPSTQLSVEVSDYDIAEPTGTVRPGAITLELTNTGADFHHLQLWRVDDAEAAAAAIEAGDLRVLETGTAVGGVGAIAGGDTHRIATDVDAGDYVMFCAIHTPAGPHNELGMVATLAVEGDPVDGSLPEAAATLTITPDGFELPVDWDGAGPLRVVNDNAFPADAEFLQLAPGKSRDDFFAFWDGSAPPPFTTRGGITALGPGASAVVVDDIPAGTYLVASFSPDPSADMVPQILTGHLVETEIR